MSSPWFADHPDFDYRPVDPPRRVSWVDPQGRPQVGELVAWCRRTSTADRAWYGWVDDEVGARSWMRADRLTPG